ncbi:MAG: hypothetical protein EZS28_029002, partial [Streblomastix strix]
MISASSVQCSRALWNNPAVSQHP